MPSARRLAAAAVVVVALFAARAGAEDEKPPEVTKAAEAALEAARPHLAEAQRAFTTKDWDASIAAYEKALAAIGDDPVLGGWRDQANYNAACAQARAGRAALAAETFAKSVKDGLRRVVGRGPTRDWVYGSGLALEHVLADADLDPIRKEKAYTDALAPYLAGGEPLIELTETADGPAAPAVIVLAADGDDAERALPAWRVAAKGRRVVLVALAGPVRPTPKERHWTLRDGDDRWAVAKIRATLDQIAKDARIDAKRVFVAGVGERPGEIAWAAGLAEPSRVAGLAAPGARFHAAWHADAIAAAPKEWRVALGAADEAPAKLLKARGIDAVRVEASNDESKVTAALLDAMLGPR
jgi:hypothetical protein